jgi:hypothetical protein
MGLEERPNIRKPKVGDSVQRSLGEPARVFCKYCI